MADVAKSAEKQFDAPLRRLDSLARCLEDGQECVAVACIQGQLFISANGLFGTKREGFSGQGAKIFPKVAEEIMKHFAAAATGAREAVSASHQKVFSTQVCTLARFKKAFKQAGSMITQRIYESATQHALLAQEASRKQLLQAHGHNLLIAGGVYNEAIDLHESFSKIEQGLLGDSEDKFTPEQIYGFSQCSTQSTEQYILHAETEPGVHAEMQILGIIIQLAEQEKIKNVEIHVGISKECCLHCHCMLEVAGKALKERYGITLTHRGDHDISFEENWVYPTVLSKTKIGEDVKDEFDAEIVARESKTDSSMGHEHASDSDSNPTPKQMIREDIDSLKIKLETLKTCPFQDSSLKTNISIIELGLFLHEKIKEFKDFFEVGPKAPQEQVKKVLNSFLMRLNVEELLTRRENVEMFLAFFESQLFANPKKELIISLLKEKILPILEELAIKESTVVQKQTPTLIGGALSSVTASYAVVGRNADELSTSAHAQLTPLRDSSGEKKRKLSDAEEAPAAKKHEKDEEESKAGDKKDDGKPKTPFT